MRKFNILAIIAAILALSLCVFASCNGGDSGKTSESPSGSAESGEANESSGDTGETGETGGTESREELAVPQIVLGDDFTVTWTAVDNATGYTVNVNGEDLGVTPSLSFPALKVAGSYAIKVKAIGNGGESGYSNTVNYSVYSVDLATGEGFTLTGDKVVYGCKNYTFTLEIKGEAYSGSVPVVKVNGVATEAGEDGKYTVENVSANLAITVEGIVKTEYTVTLPDGDGYEVRGENKVVYGEDYSFEMIKAEGYDKSELTVKVNGNAVEKGENGKYTVKTVKENLVITVEGAKKNTYMVTLPMSVAFTATGKNTVEYGEDYTFVLKISDRYDKTNLSVKVNGAAVNAEADGETYVVKAVKTDLTVTVEGLDIRTYGVTLTSGTGYELRGEDKAEHGGDYTFELVLSEGYTDSVPVVKANGETVEAGEDGKYTVGNVSGEIVITVENVKINVYTVSVKEGEGYTVDGEISKEVNYGESVSFAVAATNAEDIIKVFNGEEEIALADGVYTLESVKANAELTVRVYDLASQMFTAINLPKTEYDGYVSVGCRVVSIDSAWVEKVIKAGYTHLKFDTKLTGGVSMVLTHGGTWNKYWKSLNATDTARIDLAEFKDENGYYGWSMEVRDSAGNQTDGVVELYKPTLIKSEETAKWTKSNSSIYCAEEDGYIVLDTRCGGNDAHVLSSEAFCAKYFNNTKAKDAASQYTVIFKGRYLYAGANTRGMVWGDTSSAVSSVGGSANTDFVIEHANNRNGYAAGNKFYMGLDKEGVYQFAMSKFISSRNSWGGFSCTDFDVNTYKGNMVADQTLVYAEKIEDLIAAGYTKVIITAEYSGGQLWTGSGFGTKWIYGLNNGETKEWDLASFDTEACPYLIFYCSAAASNATVSVTFVK